MNTRSTPGFFRQFFSAAVLSTYFAATFALACLAHPAFAAAIIEGGYSSLLIAYQSGDVSLQPDPVEFTPRTASNSISGSASAIGISGGSSSTVIALANMYFTVDAAGTVVIRGNASLNISAAGSNADGGTLVASSIFAGGRQQGSWANVGPPLTSEFHVDGPTRVLVDTHLNIHASAIYDGRASATGTSSWKATFIPDVPPPRLSADDILRDAVNVFMDSNRMVHASFVPNGLSLADAAAAFGVDYFTWISWVVEDTNPSALTAGGIPLIAPYLDPPLGGYDYPGGVDDYYVPYWNETNGELAAHTSQYELTYLDAPATMPGTSMKIRTELVGVKRDVITMLKRLPKDSTFEVEVPTCTTGVRGKNLTPVPGAYGGSVSFVELTPTDIAFLESLGVEPPSGFSTVPDTSSSITMLALTLTALAALRSRYCR